ncbi:sugar nucleotide-binding protein [Gemmatimonas phototrophica]|uniref:sugar nucleotide-binding protein n=1 Tax=Gemmatimonas phototrophica TaxID=1379270 RepID=UPI0004789BEE|nr:sugar nucleotide-binding protein [Gemmatimonas phototrophica]
MVTDTLLVGPGWLGAAAALSLAAEARVHHGRVFCLSRTARPAPAGCHAVAGDIVRGANDDALLNALPERVARLVVCVAPSSARGDSYAIYPAAARGAAALADALGVASLVYISSTGIYDRQDGSEVDERTIIAPANERVQALMDAELAVLASATASRAVTVLRAAGLYGPGRDPGPRFANGLTAPDTWCNFSWRDDVVSAMVHTLALPSTGKGMVFNCTDNTPVQAGLITQALTGRAATGDTAAAGAATTTGAVRAGRSNQRISSAALLATGWAPSMPDIFAGLQALGHVLPGLEERA